MHTLICFDIIHFVDHVGESYSGSITVSKTVHGSSNLSSPVTSLKVEMNFGRFFYTQARAKKSFVFDDTRVTRAGGFIIHARLLFEKFHITQKTSREKEVFCCVKGEFFRNDLFVKSIRITIKIILLPNIIIYKYFA